MRFLSTNAAAAEDSSCPYDLVASAQITPSAYKHTGKARRRMKPVCVAAQGLEFGVVDKNSLLRVIVTLMRVSVGVD